jgi:hypothetical protein
MSKGNGKPASAPHEIDFNLRVPEGMDPTMARMAFDQILGELHMLEPLLPMALKCNVAQGLVGDLVPLQRLRQALLDAPLGATWGISIVKPTRLLGGKDDGTIIHARARLSECKTLEEVVSTASAFAFLTSAPARGVLTMQGYKIGIRKPSVPQPEDMDDGERS